MSAELLIGADIVPTQKNVSSFSSGDCASLVGQDLLNVLNDASYRVCNLEAPLTDISSPAIKRGPNLLAPISSIAGYKALGVDFVTIANNHILDQGIQGLESTIDVLNAHGISFCGAGENLLEAAKPFIFDFAGNRVGIYACVEHEFGIAKSNCPGVNPYNPLQSFDDVAELQKKADYVIVLYHGGKEYYRYPSPDLQNRCRKFIDKGANLIVCQHSHTVGAKENYKKGTIIYGQGNFLFDCGNEDGAQSSLLIRLDDKFNLSYIPLVKQGAYVRLAAKEKAGEILNDFEKRSEEISQEGFVERKYAEFSEMMLTSYLLAISGKSTNFLFRAINKLTGHRYEKIWANRAFNNDDLLAIENIVNCECHRELFLKGVVSRREKRSKK